MYKTTINSIIFLLFSTRLITLIFCLCSQSHPPLPLEKLYDDDLQQVVASALLPKSANYHGKTIDYFTNFIHRVLHVKPPVVIHGDEENHGRVVELTAKNFSSFIAEKKGVMVNFYMSRWSHYWSKERGQEFEAAANLLKGEVAFARVDASMETELADKYNVAEYPKLFTFAGGYHNQHLFVGIYREDIVRWVRSTIGVQNVMEKDEAQRILGTNSVIFLGFFDSLEGPESEQFIESSKLNPDYRYYQTASPEVAKVFHIDPQIKRPAYIIMKWNNNDCSFTRSIIADFVSTEKPPTMTTFTAAKAPCIFENPRKQLWLLDKSVSNTAKSAFEEASKAFGQELLFVYAEIGDDEMGGLLASKFKLTGDYPRIIGRYKTGLRFVSDGNITSSTIKSFGQNLLDDNLLDDLPKIPDFSLPKFILNQRPRRQRYRL
ncbi:hypothetical protein PTKIN_Ptkin16aG0117300 [Pterospermum kingtungense]